MQRIPLVVHEADKLGLHKTARLLDTALNAAGFELAELLQKGAR